MPTVFVAFGVTGDLMAQKILPALFALHEKGELPDGFEIWGVSRRDWDDPKLREHVRGALVQFAERGSFNSFLARFIFLKGDTNEQAIFDVLEEKLKERQAILYFSISPALYHTAFEFLSTSALAEKSAQLRVMIEKPFGADELSARELYHIVATTFQDAQIYRVDHYLAKESLVAIPPVESQLLSKVEIYFLETLTVDGRGEFYDVTGALRDVGQNHVLEMFGHAVGGDRADAIEAIVHLTPQEAAVQTKRGQYDGYTQVKGVQPNSTTETYFKIETRYKEARVVLEAGKAMHTTRKEIVLTFQNGTEHIYPMTENLERTEYEVLILSCMRNDQSRFVSMREVLAAWRFVDPIETAWKAGTPPLLHYMQGAGNVI